MKLDRQQVLKNLGLCARCRQCRMVCEIPIASTMLPICPTGEYYKWDTYFATGRITLAKKILLDKIEYDDSILESVYTCTLCGSCLQQCPILNFNPMEANLILRQIAVEKSIADKAYRMPDTTPITIDSCGNEAGNTALFVGSVAQSDEATVKLISAVLSKAGVEHKYCADIDAGEYLMRKGDIDAFEKLIAENITTFKAAGIKQLIAHDPLTYHVLKHNYRLHEHGVEVKFYLDLLTGKCAKKADGTKAAFHDNNYLGRAQGQYDLPRNILTELGYEIVEMVRTRENAFSCCAYPDCQPEVAELSSAVVLGDAVEAGVTELIAVCRNDAKQLAATAEKLGIRIKVSDIANLL